MIINEVFKYVVIRSSYQLLLIALSRILPQFLNILFHLYENFLPNFLGYPSDVHIQVSFHLYCHFLAHPPLFNVADALESACLCSPFCIIL